jgi:hypothetical protein
MAHCALDSRARPNFATLDYAGKMPTVEVL